MLVAQLEELRAQTPVEEEEAREREEVALRFAEGAFPVLGVSGVAPSGGSATGGKGKEGGVVRAQARVIVGCWLIRARRASRSSRIEGF